MTSLVTLGKETPENSYFFMATKMGTVKKTALKDYANVLGGVLGLGIVAAGTPFTRTAALVVVALLNLVSELVSFSRVIEAVPALRALDRLGRRHRE